MDADFHNIDTPARLALYHHLITNLVHSAVLDSLSVNKKEIGAKKQELIIKEVTENFNSLIKNLEGGISQAFEHGAAKATKSTPFFICSIKSVQGVANDGKTPC